MCVHYEPYYYCYYFISLIDFIISISIDSVLSLLTNKDNFLIMSVVVKL